MTEQEAKNHLLQNNFTLEDDKSWSAPSNDYTLTKGDIEALKYLRTKHKYKGLKR